MTRTRRLLPLAMTAAAALVLAAGAQGATTISVSREDGRYRAATIINEQGEGTTSAMLDTVRVVTRPRFTRLRFRLSGTAQGVPWARDQWGDKVWGAQQAVTPQVSGNYSVMCNRNKPFGVEYIMGDLRTTTATRRLPLVKPDTCTVKVSVSAETSDVPGLTNVAVTATNARVVVTTAR